MVAQIDEQQAAMVALAMNPAGQAHGLVFIRKAQFATGMGTIGMHEARQIRETGRLWLAPA